MDLKNGNLITPKGASLIFGTKSNSDHTNIEYKEELGYRNPYIPYTIVIDEEEDTPLTSGDILYDNTVSGLQAVNTQSAIDELKTYVDEKSSAIFMAIFEKTPFSDLLEAFNRKDSIWLQLIYDNGSRLVAPLSLYATNEKQEVTAFLFENINTGGLQNKILISCSLNNGWSINNNNVLAKATRNGAPTPTNTNYDINSYLRGIIVSSSIPNPDYGVIGDIWITYEEKTSSEGDSNGNS